jgi:Circularly permutated YpsA SLOG family
MMLGPWPSGKVAIMALAKIVSGGQTGVDRGALDAALAVGFACGGWCPKDRSAEDGPIPDRYPMMLLMGGGYRQPTLRNVLDSDGTAILFCESLSGGTLYTHDVCRRERRPYIVLDATRISVAGAAAAIVRFVEEHEIKVLNVAGPRLSKWTEGYGFALAVVGELIGRLRGEPK